MENLLILFSLGLGMGAWTLLCVRIGYGMGRETTGQAAHSYFSSNRDYEIKPEGADDPWSESQTPPVNIRPTMREQ